LGQNQSDAAFSTKFRYGGGYSEMDNYGGKFSKKGNKENTIQKKRVAQRFQHWI